MSDVDFEIQPDRAICQKSHIFHSGLRNVLNLIEGDCASEFRCGDWLGTITLIWTGTIRRWTEVSSFDTVHGCDGQTTARPIFSGLGLVYVASASSGTRPRPNGLKNFLKIHRFIHHLHYTIGLGLGLSFKIMFLPESCVRAVSDLRNIFWVTSVVFCVCRWAQLL